MSTSTRGSSRRSSPTLAARPAQVTAALSLAVAAICGVAACTGAYPVSVADLARALAGELLPDQAVTVLLSVRLPRIGTALLTGAALAVAGAAYQGLFRNPLVSPDLLGVSTGAGLGAVLGIFLSLPVIAIQLLGFAAGLATVALVWTLAAAVRRQDPLLVLVLVLSSVVVGSLAGAAISLLKILADPYDQLPAITFWLLSSLAAVSGQDLVSAAPLVALGLVPLVLLRWRVNVLTLGDEEAQALGVEAGRLRRWIVVAATLMTAAVVSIAGVIGWVGLVVPHLARLLVGPDFRVLMPVAALMGAGYLVVVDTLARTIAPVEVPLGILTALIGAPFFLWLLARGRRAWA